MKVELGTQQEITSQIPLFDEIPEGLKDQEEEIKETFDGSYKTSGITMVLNPQTGEAMHARLIDFFTGKIITYAPLARGKWTNLVGDLKEGTPAYKKLDRVYEDIRQKYEDWKYAPERRSFPIREWSVVKIQKMQSTSTSHVVSPEDFYAKVIEPIKEKIVAPDSITKEPDRKLPRQKTGWTRRSSAIIPSRDAPKLKDKRPAPLALRRSMDKEVKRLARNK